MTAPSDAYRTAIDTPECPNCGEGCGGHDVATYHVDCGEDVTDCTCAGRPVSPALVVDDKVVKPARWRGPDVAGVLGIGGNRG